MLNKRVRSYDFRDRTDCFVEGVVVGFDKEHFDCPRYKVRVERVVWDGVEQAPRSAEERFVFPPMNGVMNWFGEECNFVQKVG